MRRDLRLPLASVMIASLLTVKAGLGRDAARDRRRRVAYLVSEALTAYVDARVGALTEAPRDA